ncbi:MAG TPA: uroporphyrinogen-III synthase [Alphaproteobacteria bacterium]|nr:uroporphyrinogen-III synthase [Alphaproteobacteria bacterium]
MTGRLDHLTVLVPESRELDLFAGMLEGEGAATVRCPLVTILDVTDPAPVEDWLRRLAMGGFDDLVLLTGEGLRRLMGVAERVGMKDEAVAAIGRLRTVIRGPKPAKALREIGVSPGISAEAPTTEGVIATLKTLDLKGRRVGVQLYPGNPNAPLIDALTAAGATADAVVPYRYASDVEAEAVERAIKALAAGGIDFIAFTSMQQIERLKTVAADRGLEAVLKQGLGRTRIAVAGPVVGKVLEEMGYAIAAMPDSNFHMKPLVNAMIRAVGRD